MAVNEPGSPASLGDELTWRELAVERSLDTARTRAEERVQRFLDAALEITSEGDGDFTVQEVVERSGQSLRSFYQYFGGKHELLLAMFEELNRSSAEALRRKVDEEADPRERLHRFVVEYYRQCRPTGAEWWKTAGRPVMVRFGQQLLTAYPKEAARAFAPQATLLEELLGEAAAAGVVRTDRCNRRIVGFLLEVIMFNAFAATIAGVSVRDDEDDGAEELWDLLLHGIAVGSSA